MVTTNPARILKWDTHIGSLEAGKRADLMVVDGTGSDDYQHLLDATEAAVTMVVINGVPRYGTPALLAPFAAPTESVQVAGTAARCSWSRRRPTRWSGGCGWVRPPIASVTAWPGCPSWPKRWRALGSRRR